MPELKASKLLRTERGSLLVREIFAAVSGRFAVNAHNKLLALCGWIFEYIYEPVYQRDPGLLYKKNLHRFVAMFAYLWFSDPESGGEEATRQFQRYMRGLNENDAPLLFSTIRSPLNDDAREHPFELVLRFAHGYRSRIIEDNSDLNVALPDGGKWILDLSASAVWSHLNHWGNFNRPLKVQCDTSKPLQASIERFSGDENDPAILRARLMGRTERMGWELHSPIDFVDSRDHPAVQIADVIAGTAVYLLANQSQTVDPLIRESLDAQMMRDSIFPDFDVVDLRQREPAVNFLILYDLAKRAEANADPFSGLAEMYRQAEISWVEGAFPKAEK